jgi:hypothetical protein
MAAGCEYINQHGVKCGLGLDHPGGYELVEQLVAPDPFCLQPSDPFTLALIRGWISAAHAHQVPAIKIQRAEQHYKDIKRWQDEHGTRTPD